MGQSSIDRGGAEDDAGPKDHAPEVAERAPQRRPWQTPKVTVREVAMTEISNPPPATDGAYS